MTIKIKTSTDLTIYYYGVSKIAEDEEKIMFQSSQDSPFLIGIDKFMGTPMSAYLINIYKLYIKEIKVAPED